MSKVQDLVAEHGLGIQIIHSCGTMYEVQFEHQSSSPDNRLYVGVEVGKDTPYTGPILIPGRDSGYFLFDPDAIKDTGGYALGQRVCHIDGRAGRVVGRSAGKDDVRYDVDWDGEDRFPYSGKELRAE